MSECLVRFSSLRYDNVLDNKQFEIDNKNPPEYEGELLKIIFFMLREGVMMTFRKIISKIVDKKLAGKLYLTVLIVEKNNRQYFNLSLQTQRNPERFVIENKFYPAVSFETEKLSANPESYLPNFNQFVGTDYSILGVKENYIAIEKKNDLPQKKSIYKKGVFLYGLGDYSRAYIIPYLKNLDKVACIDYNSVLSQFCRNKFKFKNNYLVPEDSFFDLRNTERPLVIIATYHSDHTSLAKKIYEINNNSTIFIEKPPCVTLKDLEELIQLYRSNAKIEIGFNRRYIQYNQYIKRYVRSNLIIGISVKEIPIKKNHWYLWENQGTIITGNLVHWIDLANYWVSLQPVELNLLSTNKGDHGLALSILYEDGSLVNITATSSGNSLCGVQERIELRYADETIFIDDYLYFEHTKASGVKRRRKKLLRSKGHKEMYRHLVQYYEGKSVQRYTIVDLINTSVVTYYASYMFKHGIKNMQIKDTIDEFMRLV